MHKAVSDVGMATEARGVLGSTRPAGLAKVRVLKKCRPDGDQIGWPYTGQIRDVELQIAAAAAPLLLT